MMNPAALGQTIHMLLAAYAAVGFAVAGIHAFLLLRDRRNIFHRHALAIALAVGVERDTATGERRPAGADAGALSAGQIGRDEEGQFKTEQGAPLRIGGMPDEESATTPHAIEIPYGLSLLAFHDPKAVVRGLEDFPRDVWPPVAIVHIAFQVMVAAGAAMALVAFGALIWRGGANRFRIRGGFSARLWPRLRSASLRLKPVGR